MNQDSWKPSWIRGSKIEEIIWIGKSVLAWCSGIYIVFFDIVQRRKSLCWRWNQETGEGVRCLSGHTSLPVFCFAEKISQPRILVFSFPSMTKISEYSGGCATGYLANAFTAQDHVVSLGSYPHFPMIVWCWKTGEKLLIINTSIRDEVGQILRITQVGPSVIAQMGKTCGKLFTWHLSVAGKVATLIDHEVKLPNELPILWIDWSPTSNEPLLAITDIDGHIYLSNYDGSDIHRIVLSQRCGVCLDIELPMVCWFRQGIILRTTFCQIRFFAKNHRMNRWEREWYVKSATKPCILVAHPFQNEWLFYYTLEGYLMHMDFSEELQTPVIKPYLNHGAVYRFVDFVYPWCHHLVASDDLKELAVLECYSGIVVSVIDLEIEGEISSQASHPDYPLVILGTTQGEVIFVSVVDPHEPKISAYLRLQRRPLDLIKFSHSGRTLVVAEKKTGSCYCISLHQDEYYTVQALVRYQRSITDALIYETAKELKLFLLFVGDKQFSVGQQLVLFDVPEDRNLITEFTDILDLPGVYRTFYQIPGNASVIVGSPYSTRQLRTQKLQDFKDVVMIDGMTTGHYVRLANLFVDRNWITSTAFDGLVFVRDKSIRRVIAYVMTHHRADFGSAKAMMSRSGDSIVCLGYNGSLVALECNRADKKEIAATAPAGEPRAIYRVDYSLYERHKKKILSDYDSLDPAIRDILSRPLHQFPGPEEGDKTWTEWREEMQIREEKERCEEEKADILKHFDVLKGEVKKLLDDNEACPEIEKLPVSAFDLDTAGRDQKLKAARDECEDIRLELEHNCSEMNRVASWIREAFWDPQEILGKSLHAIFGDREVTNYPSVAEDPQEQDHMQWAIFSKDAVRRIIEGDTFQPWQIYSEEELQEELNKRVKLLREEDRRIDLLLEEEEEKEVSEEELRRQMAIEGTTTYRYIEPSPYYSQIELYGFDQVMLNNRFLMHDSKKLRARFNEAFDQVYELKEREMNVMRERIERIRYIDSELKTMFGQNVSHVPPVPEWHWQERPEGIINVLDHEVKAKPYISPSQQEILDKQAAEAERIRQLLLADDFRERALMAMMDGVLEVRWEDVIKIDVPKPACMLEKKPEDYTKEDIQTVKRYEKDVQFLQEERERYKRMLEAEYAKVMGLMQEGIDKFNEKLDELFRMKIKIEAAMNQIYLQYIRGHVRIRDRINALNSEDEIKRQIVEKVRYEATLQTHLRIFQDVLQELDSQHEALCNRERAMSRRFKSEFLFLNRLHVELLERQYKRRPRTNLKNLIASDFFNLGTHVASKTLPTYLPSECREYLKAVDNLDIRPNILPPTIDTSHWMHLTKVRRSKIEMELKIRAKEMEIMDVESVISDFEHKIEKHRANIEETKKNVAEYRKQQINSELDTEVQLVLNMGQVEVNLTGDLKDSQDAILISKTEIETVNEHIRAAGACKLDALKRLLDFQKGTLLNEWEHECQRKRLEDLEEDLRFIDSVVVTKEMQEYLKRVARGMEDDKTARQLAENIEAMKKRFEGMVASHRERLRSIEKEIASIRSKNEQLDRRIFENNVARCEMEQRRDLIGEARQREHAERKIRMIMRRSSLIKKLQDNYAELLELQTEHELLRLRRYPMLHFRTIDDNTEKKEPTRTGFDFCPC